MEKSPWNKKSLEIRSHQFETFVLVPTSSMILYKKVSEKKSSYSEKCMGTKDVYNHGKKGNWYKKQPHCYIQKADFRRAEENSFLWRLRTFFLFFVSLDILSSGLKFPWSYFLILFWQPPYYFRKRRPRNLKLRTLFPKTFFPRRSENWDFFTKVFIARFFSINFFSCDFLT